MINTKSFLLLISILLISITSTAQSDFNQDLALSWLKDQVITLDSWEESNIETSSLAILAFTNNGKLNEAQKGINYLINQQSSNGCWPKNSCGIKETALALLALDDFSKRTNQPDVKLTINKTLTWFDSQQIAEKADTLQIVIPNLNENVECDIAFKTTSGISHKKVDLEKGKYSTNNLGFFDTSIKDQMLEISCNLENPSDIVVSFITGTRDVYVVQEVTGSESSTVITPPKCFSRTKTCDYLSNLYASWFLSQFKTIDTTYIIGRQYSTEEQTQKNSILYLITSEDQYITNLLSYKDTKSTFDDPDAWGKNENDNNDNLYDTSFALLALKQSGDYLIEIEDWIKEKQTSSGSIGNLKETSTVLYALSSSGTFNCSSCSDASTRGECHSCKGNCFWDESYGICSSCSVTIDCSDYTDEITCKANPCKSSNCNWVNQICCPDVDGNNICDTGIITEPNCNLDDTCAEDENCNCIDCVEDERCADEDFDGDGLTNEQEVNTYGTDPTKVDTDGDGCADSFELDNNFDPLREDDPQDKPEECETIEEPTGGEEPKVNGGFKWWIFVLILFIIGIFLILYKKGLIKIKKKKQPEQKPSFIATRFPQITQKPPVNQRPILRPSIRRPLGLRRKTEPVKEPQTSDKFSKAFKELKDTFKKK